MPSRWQQIWELESCCCNSLATRWSSSQNCTTLGSEIRACTIPLGLDQSVGRMGSQTTNTRTGDWVCFNISSMAEAPRKQYAQVGDTSKTKRARSAASLNCRLNWTRLLGVSEVSGGWPGGVRLKPQIYQPSNNTRATTGTISAYLELARMTSSASYQVRDDLRKQNNQENYHDGDPEQHDAKPAPLFALIATAI